MHALGSINLDTVLCKKQEVEPTPCNSSSLAYTVLMNIQSFTCHQ